MVLVIPDDPVMVHLEPDVSDREKCLVSPSPSKRHPILSRTPYFTRSGGTVPVSFISMYKTLNVLTTTTGPEPHHRDTRPVFRPAYAPQRHALPSPAQSLTLHPRSPRTDKLPHLLSAPRAHANTPTPRMAIPPAQTSISQISSPPSLSTHRRTGQPRRRRTRTTA
jgi:hypothetical protein